MWYHQQAFYMECSGVSVRNNSRPTISWSVIPPIEILHGAWRFLCENNSRLTISGSVISILEFLKWAGTGVWEKEQQTKINGIVMMSIEILQGANEGITTLGKGGVSSISLELFKVLLSTQGRSMSWLNLYRHDTISLSQYDKQIVTVYQWINQHFFKLQINKIQLQINYGTNCERLSLKSPSRRWLKVGGAWTDCCWDSYYRLL